MNRRSLILAGLMIPISRWAIAESPIDSDILADELEKHPRCIICNMDRRKFHYARHLLHYADNHVQGTCSVQCAAECMVRERRRGYQAIYAPDFGSSLDPKQLIEAASASYLIGSDLRGVMTAVSKVPFASREAAEQARQAYGGEIGSFATAVSASLEEMAASVVRRYGNDRERLLRKARNTAS